MINTNNIQIFLLFIHGVMGVVLWIFPSLSTLIGLLVVLIGSYFILNASDPNGLLPIYFSAYIVGIEVLLRMTSSVLFWEFGKYAIILFLLLGFLRKRQVVYIYSPIIVYFIFLLPAIFLSPMESFNLWRQSVAFNLSGPACLMVSSLYFHNTQVSFEDMNKMLLFAILLIFTMSILILLKMPNFASYHFLPYSNSTTSGGYGPNQVSTIFGFGIAILGYSQIMKDYIFQYKIIDLIILALFIGLGLITFSRGGIFGVTIAFSFAVSYYIFQGQRNIQLIFKGMVLLAAVIVTWFYIVSITDGIISQRYGLSEASYGKKLIMDLTGRAEIYEMDMNIFYDHLFAGVGVGNGNKMRENYGYGKAVAAHTEYSRMLAEHGILGLFSLLMFLGISIYHLLLACSKKSKFIKILFGMLAILTLSHSAMRVAMPSFIYGFLFINYKD